MSYSINIYIYICNQAQLENKDYKVTKKCSIKVSHSISIPDLLPYFCVIELFIFPEGSRDRDTDTCN